MSFHTSEDGFVTRDHNKQEARPNPTPVKMKCKHCGLAIEPIKDSCGFTTWQRKPYGFFHVETSANSDGHYIIDCADGENEAEPESSFPGQLAPGWFSVGSLVLDYRDGVDKV